MGSLPNLRPSSSDPSLNYKHELCQPEGRFKNPINLVVHRNHVCLPVNNSNFQNGMNRFKINQDRCSQLKPHILRCNKQKSSVHCKYRHVRVRPTKSSGSHTSHCVRGASSRAIWEDNMRKKRIFNHPTCHSHVSFHKSQARHRRKDSLSSSAGTSSVRHLIAVVRSTPSRFGPVYSRRVICKNFAALCLGHATITAALLPLLSLQSSVSAWWWPASSLEETADTGSLLLSGSFAIASISSLFSPFIMHLLGCNLTLVTGYLLASTFFVAHLYPTISWLAPAYILLGISLGPIACARISYLITLADKLTYVMTEEEEEFDQNGSAKNNLIQKLLRGLQASQDLGMVIGSAVAWFFLYYLKDDATERDVMEIVFQDDDISERVCGSRSCPIFYETFQDTPQNTTWEEMYVVPCRTTALLSSVFVGCGVVAVGLTAALTDKIRVLIYKDSKERSALAAAFQGIKSAFKDTRLQLAAPLSVFIGLQQGFIFADFSKWYVVCSLSISNVSLVFLSMGLLQSVAAFTLSLLMQIAPRYLVIVTGFIFHSCLLLVLLMWKPSGDDSALFYVIAAAWGVCNIIWEILNFNLLMRIYSDSNWHTAFVHANFCKFLGLSLAFGLHGAVCTQIKLYGLAASMVIALIPHICLEMRLEEIRRHISGVTIL